VPTFRSAVLLSASESRGCQVVSTSIALISHTSPSWVGRGGQVVGTVASLCFVPSHCGRPNSQSDAMCCVRCCRHPAQYHTLRLLCVPLTHHSFMLVHGWNFGEASFSGLIRSAQLFVLCVDLSVSVLIDFAECTLPMGSRFTRCSQPRVDDAAPGLRKSSN